jgi:serine/threonine protein kinase
MHPPRQHEAEAQDFWPPVVSLAHLLLVAACERAPACFVGPTTTSSSLSASGTATEQQLSVEDFEKINLIGSGEFGKVFQVKHRQTQEVFAMKWLSKDFYMQKRMTDKALREIAMLSHAHGHPFIVKLVYNIENSREWALVMEHCPRGDLHHLLLTEGLPGLALNRAMQITAEVALALEHLHSLGIVFRDLKLENVVLDHNGRAKLTDFGLAKQRRGGHNAIVEAEQSGGSYASFTSTYCGSHGYAAPEINPRLVHGFAADLYSFGVLLLMLLMGGEVFHDARSERRLPPETPSDLREVLGRLSFDFYWASHHFLQPARAGHRVEVNLNGSMVVMSRGPRGVRRQARPRRPPNSPRVQSPDRDFEGGRSTHPAKFPAVACVSSEAEERHWDFALDLIRTLTREFPEQRGTVASVKRHAFFSEEIRDWRLVYPKTWLIERLKEKMAAQGRELPRPVLERLLEQSSSEELVSMLDDPSVSLAGLLAHQTIRPAAPPPKVAARAWAPSLGLSSDRARAAVPPDRNAPWVEQYP